MKKTSLALVLLLFATHAWAQTDIGKKEAKKAEKAAKKEERLAAAS